MTFNRFIAVNTIGRLQIYTYTVIGSQYHCIIALCSFWGKEGDDNEKEEFLQSIERSTVCTCRYPPLLLDKAW